MSKKALVFFSSPHENSYTSKILDLFMKNAKNYSFNIINCYKRKIEFCIDCGFCKEKEACIFSDMDDIDYYLRSVDLIVFAFPIYNLSFPAPLKSMLDRMQRYYSAKFFMGIDPAIKNEKKAVLIFSCGSEKNHIKIVETQIKPVLKIINCKLSGSVLLENTDKIKNFPSDCISKKLDEVIKNL